MFNLPLHTPLAALHFTFGTLFTHLRIKIRRLNYLNRILNRPDTHWTSPAFYILEEQNIGWVKSNKQTLGSLNLPTDLSTIKNQRQNEWKREVIKSRLTEECHEMNNGVKVGKTTTAHIVDLISEESYVQNPIPDRKQRHLLSLDIKCLNVVLIIGTVVVLCAFHARKQTMKIKD